MTKPAASRFFLALSALLGISSRCSATSPPSDACAVRRASLPTHSQHSLRHLEIDPKSIVSDACASYSTLDSLNNALQPAIHDLTHTTDFFSYYRLNLYNKKCPFWDDESSMCGNIACAVNTIENEEDIPQIWRAKELGKLEGPKASHPNRKTQKEKPSRPLSGKLGEGVGESCVVEYDDECDERDYCVPEDESAAAKGDYVSLVENPERFTGYSGPGANQVWEAIYRENCFSKDSLSSASSSSVGNAGSGLQASQDLRNIIRDHERQQALAGKPDGFTSFEALELDDECLEKRTFHRVISGMHASISTHLCWDYLNQTTGEWGPNVQCYRERLHEHPDRVSNLYFNYALVLRAVAKARNALKTYTFCSGDAEQDRQTKQQVLALANQIASGPTIYDESLMFQDPSVDGLKEDFRHRFRNVSRTMDCVGCDKCRLWGKLQTSGYGTALKILFEFDEHDQSDNPPLRRTELVALMNTLDKIAHSLQAVRQFHAMLEPDHMASAVHRPNPSASPRTNLFDDAGETDDGEEVREYVPREHTVSDDIYEGVMDVYVALMYVIEGWANIPTLFARTLTIGGHYLWNLWLGIPNDDVFQWEYRQVPERLRRRSEL